MKKYSVKKMIPVIIIVLVVMIIMLLPFTTDVTVRINYAKANSSYKSILYVDNGNGFQNSQKVKKRIKKSAVSFKLKKKYNNIRELRFDPVDAYCGEAITIKEVKIYAYDGLIKKYTSEMLGDILLPINDVKVLSGGEEGLVFQTEGEDPQFVFAADAMKEIRNSFSRNNTIALNVGYILFALWMLICFRKRIKKLCAGNKVKIIVTILQIIYLSFFLHAEYSTYSSNLGYHAQTTLLLGVVLVLVFVRLNWCKSTESRPFSNCIAFSILAETIYGSTLGEMFYEPLEPELILFFISVCCAVIFFCYCLWNGKDSGTFLWVFFTISLFQFAACCFGYEYTILQAFKKTIHYWSTHQCMITALALVGFFLMLRGLFGKGIAAIVYSMIYVVFLVGNLIEMIYHQSVFKPLDFLSFFEAVDVAENYLVPTTIAAILACVFVFGYCIWIFRKQIKEFMKPSVNGVSFLFGAMLMMWIFSALYYNVYGDWWIYSHYTWGSETARLKKQGYVPYFYYYCLRTKEVFPEEPENYSEENISVMLSAYESENGYNEEEIKPDVIYIMLESIFDVDELEEYGVTYSQDPNPTLDQYQIATARTSVYGGLTARAEFEALMGLSGSFYPNGTVEYLTFWGSNAQDRYSIVREFEKNGYSSCAIHQNIPNYYNRTNAYTGMGFDKYISSDTYGEDLEPADRNEDKYLTNTHFLKLLKQELNENTEVPKFIWGITIESHTPYINKYKDTDIEAKCDKISASAQKELTNYIQSVKRTDEFLAELISYIEERDKPTVIVLFGDHRPPLEALDVLGVNAENKNRYSTTCYAYSNYKQLEKPEKDISINYIPALVVEYAGIEKSGFYSYLFELQKKHPVVSSIFPDDSFTTEKENYRLLQYDIMFGEGYSGGDWKANNQ